MSATEMENRILKFRAAKKRRAPIQPIKGMPAACSFCSGDLSQSPLNAASKSDNATGTGPLAVICSNCIKRLEPLCRLMDWYQCFYRQESDLWPSLHGVIRRRFDSEIGSPVMKTTVADMLLRLLKRAFSITAGFKANGYASCPRSGVALQAPRIALICDDPDCIIRLIVAGADAVGLPAHAAMGFDLIFDDPIRELRDRCNGDPVLATIGLLILDEFAPIPAADMAVVCALATAGGLPGDIELIKVAS
jgi:hypothetical protein